MGLSTRNQAFNTWIFGGAFKAEKLMSRKWLAFFGSLSLTLFLQRWGCHKCFFSAPRVQIHTQAHSLILCAHAYSCLRDLLDMLDGANGFLSQTCIRLTNFALDQDLGPSHTIPGGLILNSNSHHPIQAAFFLRQRKGYQDSP